MTEIHTVIGAGQVGTQLARLLASRGHTVRIVRRSAFTAELPGVVRMQGDVTDPAFADQACRGATAVYNCANPPDYTRWDGVLLPLYRAVREAAGRAGARLVQLDCFYMIGRPEHAPFDERTPMNPCSPKGELRKQLVEELFEAHRRGDVRATSGRASDYFGPDTPQAAVLRPDVYDRIVKGGTVYVFGNPDMPHSYSYTPDVARGLEVLGSHEEALGRVWNLPVAAQLTTREAIERFAARAGTKVRVRRVPQWALRSVGVFVPLASALAEMSYQWDVPYLADDGDFRRTFGVGPTPLDEAIDTTLAAHARARAKAKAA
ncbi:NAD-dependent epimerase/dehydratase family protein [Paraliomyxa miuraensis]|uniref:NAD-dependent epimerase/dehydratase family protein n=1 Tax=Paraliomyxa miuraensis TaxID=376150 RepID=UPI00224D851F|nr:NAD-dependent epimerase/dehydratase family protein [Paraliomyxa miuraensis]MCX4240602.1 NAD-dependent epimerase/dehydratase family protein [Paraliomyxa miuraensis]